jgi:hypothetical protein
VRLVRVVGIHEVRQRREPIEVVLERVREGVASSVPERVVEVLARGQPEGAGIGTAAAGHHRRGAEGQVALAAEERPQGPEPQRPGGRVRERPRHQRVVDEGVGEHRGQPAEVVGRRCPDGVLHARTVPARPGRR